MAIRLTARGRPVGVRASVLGRVSHQPIRQKSRRADYIYVLPGEHARLPEREELDGHAALLTEKYCDGDILSQIPIPVVHDFGEDKLGHLWEGHIVRVDPRSGMIRSVFRPESPHNTIFATDRCNSNCIMCSQPPKDIDDSELINEHLRLVSLIERPPDVLGITGGEPTLLKDDLVSLIKLRETV